MQENWDASFEMVLKHEGGYVNDPRDPGGRTNLGVTQRAWEAWLVRTVTEADMRKLTPAAVKPFYKAMYSGTGRAAKYLQQIAGVTADGAIGPKSIEAIKACDPEQMVQALCDMRLDFLKRLPTFETFGKGWSRRVAEVKDKASGMA